MKRKVQIEFVNRNIEQELSRFVDLQSRHFSVGKLCTEPNRAGIFYRFGKWFVYTCDEHAFLNIIGPFDRDSVVCAALKMLYIKSADVQWKSEKDRSFFINNHFHDVAKIAEYMYAHHRHCPYLTQAPGENGKSYDCDRCGALYSPHKVPDQCFDAYDDYGLCNGSIQSGRL